MPSITQKIAACCLVCSGLIAAPSTWAEELLPTPQPQITQPQVIRSAFTTAISGREPVDQITRINAGQQVYYFTELAGLQGRVITHKWEKDGTFQLGMQFPVGGEHWRVQSSKSIAPTLAGTWTVTVQNDDGTILKQDTLQVDPALQPAPAMPAIPPVAPTIPGTPVPAPPAAETKPIWETLPR